MKGKADDVSVDDEDESAGVNHRGVDEHMSMRRRRTGSTNTAGTGAGNGSSDTASSYNRTVFSNVTGTTTPPQPKRVTPSTLGIETVGDMMTEGSE